MNAKYRALHPVLNEMQSVAAIDFIDQKVTLADGDVFSFEDAPPEQCINIKDKKRRDVYDGDVLHLKEKVSERWEKDRQPREGLFLVGEEQSSWGPDFGWQHISGYGCSTHIMGDTNDTMSPNIEIIGNWRMNPELCPDLLEDVESA